MIYAAGSGRRLRRRRNCGKTFTRRTASQHADQGQQVVGSQFVLKACVLHVHLRVANPEMARPYTVAHTLLVATLGLNLALLLPAANCARRYAHGPGDLAYAGTGVFSQVINSIHALREPTFRSLGRAILLQEQLH